ncbi:hypothetical protein L6250_00545 [Candidatus Parcubacteria bacterium]|nr:hypothetical protein [Patescibacteria group bacterium]MCG2688117.1 hypothetical protein [Candidatus Parcubacteria bacterium]
MEEERITREKAKQLMSIPGEARGVNLKVDWEFILKKEGKDGLKKLEDKMAELGYPLRYEDIKTMDFYPLGLDVISMVAIRDVFNYDGKKFIEMGEAAPKLSIFLKVFLKYFVSAKQALDESPQMWRRHYSIGDLNIIEFNEDKGYAVIRLENFKLHKIHCYNLLGYFSKIIEMIVKAKVSAEERKCVFDGNDYHEYFFKWK